MTVKAEGRSGYARREGMVQLLLLIQTSLLHVKRHGGHCFGQL